MHSFFCVSVYKRFKQIVLLLFETSLVIGDKMMFNMTYTSLHKQEHWLDT